MVDSKADKEKPNPILQEKGLDCSPKDFQRYSCELSEYPITHLRSGLELQEEQRKDEANFESNNHLHPKTSLSASKNHRSQQGLSSKFIQLLNGKSTFYREQYEKNYNKN